MLGGIIAEKTRIRTDLWIAVGGLALGLMVVLLTKHVESGEQDGKARPAMLLRNRSFLLLAGFYTLTMVTLFAGYVLAPNFLQEVQGFSLATIGVLFSIFSA